MRKINPKVWEILRPDEKTALGLQLVMNKSSWESGEIMEKSHYKYLEIRYRAEKFVRMFTEHLSLYDEVVDNRLISGNAITKIYFKLCLSDRLKPKEAIKEILNVPLVIKDRKEFNKIICKDLDRWKDQEGNPHEYQLYNLIKDFDRWNNFRILPIPHQEPSAFKRRVKNTYKRHIRMVSELPSISVKKIISVCKHKQGKYLYLPIIDGVIWKVVKVRDVKIVRELMKKIGLYLFKDEKVATNYIIQVEQYAFTQNKDCRDGLIFWPMYRELIKEAVNYHDVQNISPSRKYLDLALKNLTYL